ncbi:unnamed protein product [Cyprideis torosa]|uniref:GDP/GTP exchange factor Sec2 N-terminal domain-containing protein n=1 Tax=Cyprideis torosa TaxID=163714 RepID=A0A7R8W6Q9_9CRUS|nr:unnamed protein product [Cyprideis torosa]CAG0882563.1 unnamed protein product [Cyprideis torosa]
MNCSAFDVQEEGKNSNVPESQHSTPEGEESLELALKRAREQIVCQGEELMKLKSLQDKMEDEVRDLTASLFEEANKMVQSALEKQNATEKLCKEYELKIEGLQAEVSALKSLVITSTPSCPNPHLHPHIMNGRSATPQLPKRKLTHSRSTSQGSFRDLAFQNNSPTDSVKGESSPPSLLQQDREDFHVDPVLFSEFLEWKKNPILDWNIDEKGIQCHSASSFLSRIFSEDVGPSLLFPLPDGSSNMALIDGVLQGSISITTAKNSPLRSDAEKTEEEDTSECALTKEARECPYMLSLDDASSPMLISVLPRNRITAVCNCLTYLKYISRGLVKTSEEEVFRSVMKLREGVARARLGFEPNQ